MRLHALVLAGALAVPALAHAADKKTSMPSKQPAPQQQKAEQGAAPGQAQPEEKLTEAEKAQREQQILDAFKGKDNFQMQGKVLYVGQNNLVLDRAGLPVAFLIVPSTAPVQIDGKPGKVDEIQPGAEVRATFNLAQQYPIALKLDAKSAPPGSTQPGAPGSAPGTAPGAGIDNTTPNTKKTPADQTAPKDKTLGTDRSQPSAPTPTPGGL